MQTFYTRKSLEIWLENQRQNKKTIGFVPTMGALHLGHLSLIENSNSDNDVTICSVFVNPTQFNNADDLKKYPRDIEKDTNLLQQVDCDAVFFPSVEEMYPDGESSQKFEFGGLENQMEGKFRPGHFDGVATIVSRFLDIIKPNKAYFGEKDFQQLRIIQELVKQSNLNTEIVPIPIYRDQNGLALSSRNARLSKNQLNEAPKIYEILNNIKSWKQHNSVAKTIQMVKDSFEKTAMRLEYIIICDEKTLKPINNWTESTNIRAFVAAYSGDVRLIDNLKID